MNQHDNSLTHVAYVDFQVVDLPPYLKPVVVTICVFASLLIRADMPPIVHACYSFENSFRLI